MYGIREVENDFSFLFTSKGREYMKAITPNLKFKNELTPLNISDVKYIVVHHPEAKTATPEQIHDWHLQNGWSGFGYNEYIRKDGSVFIGRGDNVGAQAQGYNEVSYGICCEGNYDIETVMPKAQFDTLVERLIFHSARFKSVQIKGHRDLMSTACPGKYFPWESMMAEVNFGKIIKNPYFVSSPSFWKFRCVANRSMRGDYARQIIVKYVAMFKFCNTFEEVMNHMVTMGLVKSPMYWLENAVVGGNVRGDFMKQLIIKMGSKI